MTALVSDLEDDFKGRRKDFWKLMITVLNFSTSHWTRSNGKLHCQPPNCFHADGGGAGVKVDDFFFLSGGEYNEWIVAAIFSVRGKGGQFELSWGGGGVEVMKRKPSKFLWKCAVTLLNWVWELRRNARGRRSRCHTKWERDYIFLRLKKILYRHSNCPSFQISKSIQLMYSGFF